MSWDVTIQRFSREYAAVDAIPNDERCMPLGPRADVQLAISRLFPTTDWSDPAWGIFESAAGSIEFNLGDDEPNEGFMLHIRASEDVVPLIVALCRSNRWQALDCGNACFLEISSNPSDGLHAWTAYRDRILSES